ncbi:MAG: hypothetical protein KF860_05325 [Cyclobacteriaceae bacterium]|nr:hypothetical protein [Cyclobacteriaceae bacterium]
MKAYFSLTVLLFFLVSCSSNESNNGEKYPPFKETHEVQPASPNSTDDTKVAIKNTAHFHTVEIKQMKFVPAELTVHEGDTVLWVNKDLVAHDATEENKKLWTSGPIALGGLWSKVVTESADYYCSIHVVMKGKLTVE